MRLNLRDCFASVDRLLERRRLYVSEEQHLAEVLAEAAAMPVVPQQRTAAPVRQKAP